MQGTAGDDTIDGVYTDGDGDQVTAGNDYVVGGAGNDSIDAGDGADWIAGGIGDDTLQGGDAGDTFIIEDGFCNDIITGGEGAGAGTDEDTLDFSGLTGGIDVTFASEEAGSATDGTDTITFSEIEEITYTAFNDTVDATAQTLDQFVRTGDGDDTLQMGSGNDNIDGGFGDDSIDAGVGDDRIYLDSGSNGPGLGSDIVNGGAGYDTLYFGESNYLYSSEVGFSGTITDAGFTFTNGIDNITGSGIESFYLTYGNETVDASATTTGIDIWTGYATFENTGFDSIIGGSGDDTVDLADGRIYANLGAGDDTIISGNGDRFLQFSDGFGNDTIDASTDTDELDFSGLNTQNVDVVMTTGRDGLVTSGSDSALLAAQNTSEFERFILSNDADSFSATGSTVGFDVDGGTGDDTLVGADGTDRLDGGADNDHLDGGLGVDFLYGGAGDDMLVVGGGNSATPYTLVGDGETVTGTTGSDVFVWDAQTGTNSQITLDDGGGTQTDGDGVGDTIQVLGDAATGTLIVHGFDANADKIYLSGAYSDYYNVASISQVQAAGVATFTVTYDNGNAQTFEIHHNNGTFLSQYTAFEIWEDFADLNLDRVEGGDDADTFVVADGFDGDTIVGGEGGVDEDVVDLSAVTGGVTATYTDNEAGTVALGADTLAFSETEKLVGTTLADDVDATATTLGTSVDLAGGNDTFVGGSGGDTVTGGAGDDSISGGAGDDLLKTGQGNDTLDGGDGNDTLMNSAGDDTLIGGSGNDLLVATTGNDSLDGGAGNDTLMGGTDNDNIDGGAGNDLILGDLAGVAFNTSGTDGAGLVSGINDFPTGALTFEITFSSTDGANTTPLASYASTADADDFALYTSGGTYWVAIGGSPVDTGVSTATLFDGNVHTLAVTWDSATGDLALFGDGASLYAGTHATGQSITQGGNFALGQEQDALGGGFDSAEIFQGTIYGTRLYDDVRAPGEILDSSLGPVADTSDPNLIANWVADPDTATFTDQTANHAMVMSGDVLISASAGADTLQGGDGDDVIYGGGGIDEIYGGTGNDAITFAQGDTATGGHGDDIFILADYAEPGTGNVTIAGGGGAESGVGDTLDLGPDADLSTVNVTATYTNASGNTSQDGTYQMADGSTVTFTNIESVVCFTTSTAIRTPRGEVPVERLRVGDMVQTLDNGAQPIAWIGQRHLSEAELKRHPKLRPVEIKPGMIDAARPLIVSRQHRILIQTESDELLVPAIHLTKLPGSGARVMKGTRTVSYYHIMFEEHQVIWANGAPAESFLPGPMAFEALGAAQQRQLNAQFTSLPTRLARRSVPLGELRQKLLSVA